MPPDAGGISDVLREVDAPTITRTQCADYYGSMIVTDKVVCIDTAGGKGTCNVSLFTLFIVFL